METKLSCLPASMTADDTTGIEGLSHFTGDNFNAKPLTILFQNVVQGVRGRDQGVNLDWTISTLQTPAVKTEPFYFSQSNCNPKTFNLDALVCLK